MHCYILFCVVLFCFESVPVPGILSIPLITVSGGNLKLWFNPSKSYYLKSGNTQGITQYHRVSMNDDIMLGFNCCQKKGNQAAIAHSELLFT